MTNSGALAVSKQGVEPRALASFVSPTSKSNSAGIYEGVIQ